MHCYLIRYEQRMTAIIFKNLKRNFNSMKLDNL